MKTAIVLVTDAKGLALTQHAVAAAMITQIERHDYLIYCDGFATPMNDLLILAGQSRNVRVEYRPITADYNTSASKSYRVTKTALLKFDAIADACPQYDRVLYMDGDILLMKNFGLENIGFDNHPIAAIYDIAESGGLSDPKFRENCAASGYSHHYFNSGIIAVDCNRWDQDALREKYQLFAEQHKASCVYKSNCLNVDQCVWNMLFDRRWKRLPLTMNLQACAMFSDRWTHATVRHYVGAKKFLPHRPWRNDAKDCLLISQAKHILGLKEEFTAGSSLIRRLNVFHKEQYNFDIGNVIDSIEKMYAQNFQD